MWDETVSGFFRAPLPTTPSNSALTSFGPYTTTQATQQAVWAQFISDTLDVAQTITTPNIDAICRGSENATGDNTYFALSVRVVSRDGSTVRGTIKQQQTNTGGSEFGTALRTRIWDNLATSTVNAQAGDRIVIEIGQHAQGPTVAPQGTMRFGDPTSSSDFALTTNLTTDLRTWLEFTDVTLTFGSPDHLATPGVGSLTLTGLAPTVTASNHKLATPGVGSLSLTGLAPTVSVASAGSSYSGTPGVGSLTLTGLAPSALAPRLVTPGVGALLISDEVSLPPTVTATAHRLVVPGAGQLIINDAGPTPPTVLTPRLATPGVRSLSLTGFAPTVTAALTAIPGTASLALSGLAPSVSAPRLAVPSVGSLTLAGLAASVAVTVLSVPAPGALSLAGFAPSISTPVRVTPGVGALILSDAQTFPPTVAVGAYAVPGTASLTIAGRGPLVAVSQSVLATPAVAAIALTGFAPTVAAAAPVLGRYERGSNAIRVEAWSQLSALADSVLGIKSIDAYFDNAPRAVTIDGSFSSTDDAGSITVEGLTIVDAVQRDDRLPCTDAIFRDFGGANGLEIIMARNTGGWLRMRPTSEVTISAPKIIQECFDGSPYDAVAPASATTGAANKRIFVAQGRVRSSIRLSDQVRMPDEDRADFNVTGSAIVTEEPQALSLDETNKALFTVTKQGGVYLEDVTRQYAPIRVAETSLDSLLGTGEFLTDVKFYNEGSYRYVVVLSTKRLIVLSVNGNTLSYVGETESIAQLNAHASYTGLNMTTFDKMVVGKNGAGDAVAYCVVQCAGYEIAPISRPFARVILACDLNISAGATSDQAPRFLIATPRIYNPFPVAPSGWSAYSAANGNVTKTDYSVFDLALTSNAGVDYLYVSHGRMAQVRRLTVTQVLRQGFIAGALIPCHPGYSATPGSNTAERIVNIAVHPTNFERFLIAEYETDFRVVQLSAGTENVASNNALANVQCNKGAIRKIPIVAMSGGLDVAWHFDNYFAKHIRRGIDISTASPVASFEKGWTFAMDGINASTVLDAVFTLTFGGVLAATRAAIDDDFVIDFETYRPSYGTDPISGYTRGTVTEQMDLIHDFPNVGDISIITANGEGGFMHYVVNNATKTAGVPVWYPQPAELVDVVGGPLDGWIANAPLNVPSPGRYYSNVAVIRQIDGEMYVLQDVTNRELGQWAVLAWRWNGSSFDFVTAGVHQTAYDPYDIVLSGYLHVTETFASSGKTFAFLSPGPQTSTTDAHLVVFDLSALTIADTITVVDAYDLSPPFRCLGGIASNGARLFIAHRALGSPAVGGVSIYSFDEDTGIVDTSALLSVASTSYPLPTNGDWSNPWFLRFHETDPIGGGGILALGSAGGTYVEMEYTVTTTALRDIDAIVSIQWTDTERRGTGDGGATLAYRFRGTLRIALLTNAHDGDGLLTTAADYLVAAYRGLDSGEIHYETAAIVNGAAGVPETAASRSPGSSESLGRSRYAVTVEIPFWLDEDNPRITDFERAVGALSDDVAEVCRTRFQNLVAGPAGIQTAYDNAPPIVPLPRNAIAALDVIFGGSELATLGASSRGYRDVGIMQATLLVPLKTGDKAALSLADSIFDAFHSVEDRAVNFLSPTIRNAGRVGSHWRVIVDVPFLAEQT